MNTRKISGDTVQRYLSVEQTAIYLGLSPKTIYSWAEKREIPAYKVGRVWRFDKAELDDFVRGKGDAFI
jgi:excisionase family DNA binding protein